MRTHRVLPLLLLVAGCHKAPKPVDFSQVFPNFPLPPNPQLLVRQTGVDAMQFTLVSTSPVDSVAAYYRRVLTTAPFQLVNEHADGKNISFYAEQAGPSIWITVKPTAAGGSEVTIAGARAAETTKAAAGH